MYILFLLLLLESISLFPYVKIFCIMDTVLTCKYTKMYKKTLVWQILRIQICVLKLWDNVQLKLLCRKWYQLCNLSFKFQKGQILEDILQKTHKILFPHSGLIRSMSKTENFITIRRRTESSSYYALFLRYWIIGVFLDGGCRTLTSTTNGSSISFKNWIHLLSIKITWKKIVVLWNNMNIMSTISKFPLKWGVRKQGNG